jgi:hypothetical protein
MQKSIAWCVTQGLVLKEGKKLKLTKEGLNLLNRSSANTTSDMWKYLEKQFDEIGVDNTQQINPKTMDT